MIISKDELFVLLNYYYLKGDREVSIEYPIYQLRLFTLNLENFTLRDFTTPKEIENKRRKNHLDEFLRRDLPDYRDMLDSFVSAGLGKFENEGSIEENFRLLRESIKDKTVYIKPIFVGIDTNIAYYRIISRRIKNHFKYVISQIVVGEIDARIHTKYSGRMLHHFENLPYYNIVREFANGSAKEARKAKNAMNEIYYLFDVLDSFRTGKSSETKDKEVRDREIALQYRNFADEIDAEVVLFTADKDMVFHAQAQGISSIYFKLPHLLDVDEVDPLRIPYLLYDLAVNFGVIKINDTVILSEWRGKEVEHYMNENLKVYNAEKCLARDIQVCRGLMNEF